MPHFSLLSQRNVLIPALLLSACGPITTPNVGREASRPDALETSVEPDSGIDPVDSGTPPPDALPDGCTPHGPPYPIVLQHGFAGFRDIGPINYFYNVGADLRARGEVVFESVVSPFNSPAVRAGEMAVNIDRYLAQTCSAKVVIVAHSQGGLDARYLISTRGYANRVALLATVSTPHRGTSVADAFLGILPTWFDPVINTFATLLGISYNEAKNNANLRSSLTGLSERDAATFNAQNPDDPRVVYWSWAGRSLRRGGDTVCAGARIPNDSAHVDDMNLLISPFGTLLEDNDPILNVNDGMVRVSSARWGIFMGCVPADHFDEVGQIARSGPVPGSGFDHLAFYRDIVRRVHEAGY